MGKKSIKKKKNLRSSIRPFNFKVNVFVEKWRVCCADGCLLSLLEADSLRLGGKGSPVAYYHAKAASSAYDDCNINSQGFLRLRGSSGSGEFHLPPAPHPPASRFNKDYIMEKVCHVSLRIKAVTIGGCLTVMSLKHILPLRAHTLSPSPLPSHPEPSASPTIKGSIIGERKIWSKLSTANCRFSMDSIKATLTISLINGWHLWLEERRCILLCLSLC